MPLSLEKLHDLQADALAEDIPIDFERMSLWTEAQVIEFFESGGQVAPSSLTPTEASPAPGVDGVALVRTSPDQVVAELLEELELTELSRALAPCSWEMLAAAHAAGRSTLMKVLKEHGVQGVSTMQKLANAVGKLQREGVTKKGRSLAHPCALRRKKLAHLPPHKRLSIAELKENVPKVLPGEWFGIPFPISFEMLMSPKFGASFLTIAFHKAGTLSQSNSVVRIRSIDELPLQGDDAQGGAGIKAIIRVEYAQHDPSLHETLFVKMPLGMHESEHYRVTLSSMYGDGDGRELATYVFLEDLLPVRIPKFYFADISRQSTNYILITECIPFGEASGLQGDEAVGKILPKNGKFQDDRLPNAHEYYYALMKAFARVAAADKCGKYDSVVDFFIGGVGIGNAVKRESISEHRRKMHVARATANLDTLIEFVFLAPNIFPAELADPVFLNETKAKCIECARYFDEAVLYASEKPEFTALTHVNLQLDNGFFWRTAAGELEAGLLDWYNLTRAPFAAIFMGCLSGAEPGVLTTHIESLMRCFAAEYEKEGGPSIDPLELLLQFKLLYTSNMLSHFSYIASDVYREGPPKEEWKTILSKEDPRVMGRWNVRCRVIAVIQSLAFWKMQNLHEVFMKWVRAGFK
ncbi:hypothetical protein AB1Y20_018066 [Prymnesium parvum]|uniref:Uncharacterized protein n=1 Tax=Prymnesium parvum TaxID=97485 RepID=A0AB34JMG5_PRYPA